MKRQLAGESPEANPTEREQPKSGSHPSPVAIAGRQSKHAEEQFVELLTSSQSRLFAYIYALTAEANLAADILQETNRQLWRRSNEYDPSRPFLPWAQAHAFNQVRTTRKKQKRERLVFHQDETLQRLSDHESSPHDQTQEKIVALEDCLKQLPTQQRQLIRDYYERDRSLAEIAATNHQRENTLAVTLHRIRQALSKCIRGKVHAS